MLRSPGTIESLAKISLSSVLPRGPQFQYIEPVGSKAPTLTGGDVKGVWMEKGTNSSIVLQCPAQAYPVPSFRTCRRQSTSIDGQRSWRYDEQPSRIVSRVVLSSSGLSRTYV
ncbi:hypothetical protein M0804_000248 [Polistes exclamans]|nr:hypothetical protein M0804_000248 [Polistes exclamans]